MAAAMSEAALYTQLCHYHRLLDPSLALFRLKDDTERLEATRYVSQQVAYSPMDPAGPIVLADPSAAAKIARLCCWALSRHCTLMFTLSGTLCWSGQTR